MAGPVLVTGGAGFIGSHCVLQLAQAGYEPVVVDNLHNAIAGPDGLPESLRRVQLLARRPIAFQQLDVTDGAALQELFSKHRFSAVVHFAGLKAVGESVQQPLEYYRVNLTGTIRLLEAMKAHGVKNIVFSSSATVYGDPKYLPLDENHPVGGCTNPYGKSKYFIEEMIRDLCKADKAWNAVILRYFNPIGAHESGMIGEDPQGIPNNLMPYVAQVAVGRREFLSVFGNDYETIDGTGVRDYIHVVDLAKGHIAALQKLKENCGCKVYNLGTGTGYSVLQMVRAMEKASGREIKYKITARREGDVASCYANPELPLATPAPGLQQLHTKLRRRQPPAPSPSTGRGRAPPAASSSFAGLRLPQGNEAQNNPGNWGGVGQSRLPRLGGGLLRTSRAGRAGLEPPHSPHPPGRCLPGPDRARASPPRAGGHSRAAAPSPGGLFSLFIFVKRHFQPRGAQRCRGLSPGRGGERRGEGQHCLAARGRAGGSREPPRGLPRPPSPGGHSQPAG
uniref:UDP-N-acetylglucosamine 4-epimerase n=1 Tax=Anas zonorhyncha TaxID=75864 RepID=A0A8B9UID2_9AVES